MLFLMLRETLHEELTRSWCIGPDSILPMHDHLMGKSTLDTCRFYHTFLRFYGELVRIPPHTILM